MHAPKALIRGGLLTLAMLASAGAAATDLEQRVKAAYLYNFAKFVEWPQSSGGVGDAVDICVFYDAEFEQLLQKIFTGKTVSDKPVMVHTAREMPPSTRCDIVFVGAEVRRDDVQTGMQGMAEQPILTVGESTDFTRDGGAIRFMQVDGKLRFEIDLGNTQRTGLKISSKLLRVAKVIPARAS